MKIEPSGDLRGMAGTMMQTFTAFRDVGFTREQAFQLTRDVLITAIANNNGDQDREQE